MRKLLDKLNISFTFIPRIVLLNQFFLFIICMLIIKFIMTKYIRVYFIIIQLFDIC